MAGHFGRMAEENVSDKKVNIRPRRLSLSRIAEIRKKQLRPSGAKFPAKMGRREEMDDEISLEDGEVSDDDKPVDDLKASERADAAKAVKKSSPRSDVVAEEAVEKAGEGSVETASDERFGRRVVVSGSKGKVIFIRAARRFSALKSPLWLALFAGGVIVIWTGIQSYQSGVEAGRKVAEAEAEAEAVKERVALKPEVLERLNAALAELRRGDPAKALQAFSELELQHPEVSSLTYLTGLAAMQNGDIELAGRKVQESIVKRERVSDALTLQAVLETQKRSEPGIATLGDGRLRSEDYLRRAITADVANPLPMIELGTLFRYQKRNEEARALLEGARHRLQPVDSTTVVDVSLALMALQETADGALPVIENPTKDATTLFSAGYIALRQGQPDTAVESFHNARQRLTPDLFYYLINDPAIRRFVDEPKMREFFE